MVVLIARSPSTGENSIEGCFEESRRWGGKREGRGWTTMAVEFEVVLVVVMGGRWSVRAIM